jgi:hypothetical protein
VNHYFWILIPLLFFGILVSLRGKATFGNLVPVLFVTMLVLVWDISFSKNLIAQFESRNYPSTTGSIIHSEIASLTSTPSAASASRAPHTSYGVNFEYRYELNGQSYNATRFRYDHYFWTHEWAQQTVANHPAGSQIQVFYNPQNPADALLSAGINTQDMILILILALLNLFAIWLWRGIGKKIRSV